MDVSVVILSYNRRDALLRTLRELASQGLPGKRDALASEVIVVDNASTDGSVEAVAREFPSVRVLALRENTGVAGFNVGAGGASGEFLLILDDDSWPDVGVLPRAVEALRERPTLGGVALVPRHPATRASEWPFARVRTDACPVFGCGNLMRASAWRSVGGYEEAFFLYRNDVDLALKLLGAGMGVLMDPPWTVWHDSPAASRKGERWLRLATRNWAWLCRRHAPWGVTRALALGAGLLTAMRHAGASPRRLAMVLRGELEGLASAPPPVPQGVRTDGSALRTLLRARWHGRQASQVGASQS